MSFWMTRKRRAETERSWTPPGDGRVQDDRKGERGGKVWQDKAEGGTVFPPQPSRIKRRRSVNPERFWTPVRGRTVSRMTDVMD
jgi:hypothetical protein